MDDVEPYCHGWSNTRRHDDDDDDNDEPGAIWTIQYNQWRVVGVRN